MIYEPEEVDFKNYKEADKKIKNNFNRLVNIDKTSKRIGKVLYRFIAEPYADGRAYYQIIKINKKTVKIKVCTGLGDDWVIPYWGHECNIDKDFALRKLKYRDDMEKLFSKRG